MRPVTTILPILFLPAIAAAQTTIQPGLWEITSTTTNAVMPNMPPQVAARMKGRTTTLRQCITPADVARGLAKTQANCRITRNEWVGGHVNVAMTCGAMEMTSTGRYTPTSFDYTTTSAIASGQLGGMRTTANVSGKRIGACK